MRTMNFKTLAFFAMIFAGLAFTACELVEQTDQNDPLNSSTGKLKILLTDAPFPADMVAEANVVINKVEIRKADGEDEGYPFIVLSEEEMSFNLLDLTNGVTADLVDIEIDSGSYDLVRLYVADASIMLKDSTVYDLKVPSGAQTGIKIFIDPAIEVAGGLTAELLLDFDVSKSFVVQGNPNTPAGIKGFHFKPVVKASNLTTAGRLWGYVTDTTGVAIDGAEVSILAADTVYTTSFTDTTGMYSVIGIEAGMYNVGFAKEGYQADSVENVEIVAGNATTLDMVLTPTEDEGESLGEGEGDNTGEGEGDNSGEGEGEGDNSGEGEGAGE